MFEYQITHPSFKFRDGFEHTFPFITILWSTHKSKLISQNSMLLIFIAVLSSVVLLRCSLGNLNIVCVLLHVCGGLGSNMVTVCDSSPKNEISVINYLPSFHSKLLLICEKQLEKPDFCPFIQNSDASEST